jgi:DNA-binding NtrC family response regulator
MLLDVRLPGISGFEVLKIVRENYPYIEVIVISVLKELDVAIEAMRLRRVSLRLEGLRPRGRADTGREASERQDLNRDVLRLSAEVAEQHDREFVAGASRNTKEVLELVAKVAKLSATVLILGESGTGKELLARSSTANRPTPTRRL